MKKIESLQGLRLILFLTIFIYHAAIIDVIYESTLHKFLFRGGGLISVAYFFVLSGFVGALSCEKIENWDLKSYFKYLKKRIIQFYPYHLLFLIVALPLSYSLFINDIKKALTKLVYCLFLVQSWNPDKEIWTAYNGVAWFLSTSLFLTACLPILHLLYKKVCKLINNEIVLNIGMIVLCFVGMCALAYASEENVGYWLYAFPPARLIDFTGGFCLARLFMVSKERIECEKTENRGVNIGIIGIYVFYLIVYNYVDYSFSRGCIYFPGAIVTIWGLATTSSFLEKFLSNKWMVKLGEGTLYFMLCHQVVLYYFGIVINKLKFINSLFGYIILLGILVLIYMSYHIIKRIKDRE